MTIQIDVHIHVPPPPEQADVSQILAALEGLKSLMSAALNTLQTEVSEIGTVVDSAIVFIQGIKAQLDAAATDPAKMAELSASLDSKAAALAGAIAANTTAATETPVTPTPGDIGATDAAAAEGAQTAIEQTDSAGA